MIVLVLTAATIEGVSNVIALRWRWLLLNNVMAAIAKAKVNFDIEYHFDMLLIRTSSRLMWQNIGLHFSSN